jgi:hypothetical protein
LWLHTLSNFSSQFSHTIKQLKHARPCCMSFSQGLVSVLLYNHLCNSKLPQVPLYFCMQGRQLGEHTADRHF